jgi:hypothetical protein
MKTLRLIYISVGLIFIFTIAGQFLKTKKIDWTPTFNYEDKNPFGLYIFGNTVNKFFDNNVTVYKKSLYELNIDYKNISNHNILIIADKTDFKVSEVEDIYNLLKQGNTIFIGSTYFGDLEKKLGLQTQMWKYFTYLPDNSYDNNYEIRFLNKNWKQNDSFVDPIGNSYIFNATDLKVKGNIYLTSNFSDPMLVKLNINGGILYLFTLPYCFTNINLLDNTRRPLSELCLSLLPNQATVVIDSYSLNNNHNSPMKFILGNSSLKSGFYLLVFTVIFFMIFGIKREQRLIPVLSKPINSSKEFISTIARLSFAKKDNLGIAYKKINNFHSFIRNNLNITINHNDVLYREQVKLKSGLKDIEIEILFKTINKVSKMNEISEHSLVNLCNLIDNFYKKVFYE